VRFVLGAVLILWGLYSAVFYRRGAKRGVSFHRAAARMLPWLYRLPVARAHTSQKLWRPLALVGGLFLVGVGIFFIMVTPPK
jgi:hypothetical protein